MMETTAPTVGIVVPVKRSQSSIRACVESLLAQDYTGSLEIVLVGDVGDPTWEPISDIIASGKIRIIETMIQSARRDANAKRNIGLHSLSTEILVLTDSDMILPSSWVSTAVALIEEGWSCVAGPMRSVNEGFWPSYIDDSPLMSKTPRMDEAYVVTAENFGLTAKPPITANVAFTSEVLKQTGGLNPDFTYSYEDYEFFDRVTRLGFAVYCTPVLVGDHSHREGFFTLLRDYFNTGRGAADLVTLNPNSKLSKRRWLEVILGLNAIVLPAMVIPALATTHTGWLYGIAGLLSLLLIGLSVYCALSVRQLWAIFFPFVTVLFGMASWYGFWHRQFSIWKHGVHPTITLLTHERSISQETS